MIQKLKSFLLQCTRVWHVLRKPDSSEYKMVAKVSALGILAIGGIGFVISIIMHLFTALIKILQMHQVQTYLERVSLKYS